VPDAAIGTTQLANLAVTGDKIMDNTIPVSKLTGAGANFWDGNGTDVWRPAGKVGIGIASPTAKLHVVGTTTLHGLVEAGGATTANHFEITGNQIQQRLNTATAKMLLNSSGGDVQLGNANSDVVVPGTINDVKLSPYTLNVEAVEAGFSTYRTIPDSVVREYLADAEGGRIRLIATRPSDGYVWVIDETIFINPDNGRGYCTQMGGAAVAFVLKDNVINNIIPNAWNMIRIHDHDGYPWGATFGTVYPDLRLQVGLTSAPFGSVSLVVKIFDQ
jgi:hypothetical protein